MEANNMAKLHEVVSDLLYMAERYVKKTPATESVIFDAKTKKEIRTINYYDVIARAKAALAAPPHRNCEVGTAEEQLKRQHDTMCNTTKACPDSDWSCRKCFAEWSQMPYKEGGAK